MGHLNKVNMSILLAHSHILNEKVLFGIIDHLGRRDSAVSSLHLLAAIKCKTS